MNWHLLLNSFAVSLGATLLAMVFGLAVAVTLMAAAPLARRVLLAAAVMAFALPPFVVTNCWLHYLGAAGVWHAWLPVNLFSLGGTVWILALLLWPITALLVGGAWQKLEAAQFEADPALRGGALLRWLLLPAAAPTLRLSALLTGVLALNNFAVPAILQVHVIPADVWVQFNTALDPVAALRSSWPLVVVPVIVLIGLRRREIAWPRAAGPVPARIFRRQFGAPGLALGGTVTVLLGLISVGLPLVQLLSTPRTWTELPSAFAAGLNAAGHSAAYALAAATGTTAIGLLVAAPGATRSGEDSLLPLRRIAGGLGWLALLVPGVLLGIGLIVVFNRPPFLAFYRSAGIVIVALVLRYLALGWHGAERAVRSTDPDLVDVARLEGATRWQMLRRVLWPQIAPPIAAVGYVVYLLCLWDVESLVLILPPGGETLAHRIFNLLHYGHNAQVNALCLILLGLAAAPLAIWTAARVARRLLHRRGGRIVTAGFAGLALAGCGPSGNEMSAPVESRFFSQVQVIGTRGVAPGEFNKPRSLAVDRDDNLYVVDMTGRVQKFSPDGRYLLSWQMPQTDLGKPKGMGRDAAGNIIVVEPHYQRVNHFTPAGRLVDQWGVSGTNAGQLKMPRAVAVNRRGEIFVSEYGLVERVQKFSADGRRFLGGFGRAGTAPGEFNRPEGLGIDAADRLYVADSCNHRIEIFSDAGQFRREFGTAGSGPGELSYPYDVCVDAAGRSYVCEFGNSRIQVFDAGGKSLEILGGPGSAPGKFSNPWSLALDSKGNLYVADSQNHRVQKFLRRADDLAATRRPGA